MKILINYSDCREIVSFFSFSNDETLKGSSFEIFGKFLLEFSNFWYDGGTRHWLVKKIIFFLIFVFSSKDDYDITLTSNYKDKWCSYHKLYKQEYRKNTEWSWA